jgi:hypothetical protein
MVLGAAGLLAYSEGFSSILWSCLYAFSSNRMDLIVAIPWPSMHSKTSDTAADNVNSICPILCSSKAMGRQF